MSTAAVGALQRVALPQERIGVPVADDEAVVESRGLGGDGVGGVVRDHVHAAFGDSRGEDEEAREAEGEGGKHEAQDPLDDAHDVLPVVDGTV